MTAPFLSDVGVTMTALQDSDGGMIKELVNKMKLLFNPLAPLMWLTTVILICLISLTLWMIEHGRDEGRFNAQNIETLTTRAQFQILENHEFDVRPQHAMGYFTKEAFINKIPEIFENVMLTLTAHDRLVPVTRRGKVLNNMFCFFSLIWMASYTANLATQLGKDTSTHAFNSLDDLIIKQKTENVKPACVKGSTAYGNWLKKAYPDLEMYEGPGSYKDLYNLLSDNTCSCVLDDFPISIYTTNSPLYCSSGVEIVGNPLAFGNLDMGVGVRKDLPVVREVLSYWIQELRSCKSNIPGGACFGERNMDDLLKMHAETGQCAGKQSSSDDGSLGVQVFLPFIVILTIMCIFSVSFELMYDKKARKALQRHKHLASACRSSSLGNYKTNILSFIKEDYPNVIDEHDEVDYDAWASTWESLMESPQFYNEIMKRISYHYLSTDTTTWKLLRQTRKRLMNQTFVLREVHGFSTVAEGLASTEKGNKGDASSELNGKIGAGEKKHKHIRYTLSIICNCFDILEMLTNRALEEVTERQENFYVRKERVKAAKAKMAAKANSSNSSKNIFSKQGLVSNFNSGINLVNLNSDRIIKETMRDVESHGSPAITALERDSGSLRNVPTKRISGRASLKSAVTLSLERRSASDLQEVVTTLGAEEVGRKSASNEEAVEQPQKEQAAEKAAKSWIDKVFK